MKLRKPVAGLDAEALKRTYFLPEEWLQVREMPGTFWWGTAEMTQRELALPLP